MFQSLGASFDLGPLGIYPVCPEPYITSIKTKLISVQLDTVLVLDKHTFEQNILLQCSMNAHDLLWSIK